VDADFILQVPRGKYEKLLVILDEAGLQVDKRKISRQLSSKYNIISIPDKQSSHKAYFMIHPRGKLERRAGSLLGIQTYYQAPEALVLAKLRMIKTTLPRERSLKDKEDIRAILKNTRVDKAKIFHTARRETTLTIFQDLTRRGVETWSQA